MSTISVAKSCSDQVNGEAHAKEREEDVEEGERQGAGDVVLGEGDWANMEMRKNWSKDESWVCATGDYRVTLKSDDENNDRDEDDWEDIHKKPGKDWDPCGVEKS